MRSELNVPESVIAQRNSLCDPEDVLESGAVGLSFFDRFHGAAAQMGLDHRTRSCYDEMYRAESGIDLTALSNDISRMLAAVDIVSADSRFCVTLSDSLADIWNVEGVDYVSAQVREEGRRAEADVESMPILASASGEFSRIVRTALVDKAFKVSSLDRETVGGIDAKGIDQLAAVCRDGGIDAVEEAATWFAPLSDMRFRGVRNAHPFAQVETCRAAVDLVHPWFDRVFRKVYLDTRDEFDRACEDCRAALTEAFGVVTGVATQLFPIESESVGEGSWSEPSVLSKESAALLKESSLDLVVGTDTWGFSVAPDGRGVSLEVRDPIGGSLTVTVELDENGWPRIVVDADTNVGLDAGRVPEPESAPEPELVPTVSEAPEQQAEPVTVSDPVEIPESNEFQYQLPDPVPLDSVPIDSGSSPEESPRPEGSPAAVETGAELAGAGPI
ncbi:hypothetical protein [Rhodococcus sp. IEGM 1379]|uniref:hypothetical protein n=1 Tax=Rhodococcus sp. IEGM 1379 TaxID=3047086 RepID=UPI0024B79FEA|nr:hypothetical protein [Rhodococcus sp. IEGM 1379]MDI9917925.1 hypothetical protein [Rhodococcus sp. IEGM 1379]